jgi:hypothetical protein
LREHLNNWGWCRSESREVERIQLKIPLSRLQLWNRNWTVSSLRIIYCWQCLRLSSNKASAHIVNFPVSPYWDSSSVKSACHGIFPKCRERGPVTSICVLHPEILDVRGRFLIISQHYQYQEPIPWPDTLHFTPPIIWEASGR